MPTLIISPFARKGYVDHASYDTTSIIKLITRRFDLEPLADRFLDEVSGGQRQRAYIAMVLAQDTDCILLDEPLSNLDVASRLELRSELRRLVRERGTTILCVLHDQKDALAMADRLGIMRGGKVIQSGLPIDVYRRPDPAHGRAGLVPDRFAIRREPAVAAIAAAQAFRG